MATHIENINNHDGGVINIHHLEHKVPSQLTSKLGKSTIIGRGKELKEIDHLLKNNDSLLIINGIGGVGKSTIASYYLHSQKENYDYYGFFEGLESFIVELRPRLNLKSEKLDELFLEALAKLSTLEGNKLLVLDDVKESEENQEVIDKILGLRDSGYKILITSRQKINSLNEYTLHTLLPKDARELFLKYYPTQEWDKVDTIVGYLDNHALFVELVAKTVESEGYELDEIVESFEEGRLSKIVFIDEKTGDDALFNQILQKLFDMQQHSLKDEYILLLKQLATLPSIDIEYSFLEKILGKKQLKGRLNFLVKQGWLTKLEGGYKLHQIIKEYLLANHTPSFKEIEVVVDSFGKIMGNAEDVKKAMDNREKIIYFENLATLLKILEIENKKVGIFFNTFGLIYHHLAFYEKAKLLYLKALEIHDKQLREKYPYIAISYNNLASLYQSMGKYKKAESFFLKALKIREKQLGEEYPYAAISYNNLALFYKSMGQYKKAEPSLLKALKMREQQLGENHPSTAISYNDLAELYKSMNKYKESELLFLKALKINKKQLEEDHPYTVASYNNLALLYNSMGEYKKAEPLSLKVLEISKKLLGEEHPDTARCYSNMARLYQSMGKYKEAEPLFLKASEQLGEEHPFAVVIYNNLAEFYYIIGKYDKAESYYLKVLSIRKKVLGEEHASTVKSYNNLAVTYYRQGNFEKADDYMKKVVETPLRILPEGHLDLIEAQKKFKSIQKAVPVSSKKVGRNDPCSCNSGKKYKKCCGKYNTLAKKIS